ncbi:MAG: nuclear transport factor 2 family protein [Bryobacteraceae bacterium]|jgi:hypothetical protein
MSSELEKADNKKRWSALLASVYAAFNAREIDTVLANLHPDVDWPNGMEGGRIHGRENVREYWTRQWAMLDPHVEPVRFEDEPGGRTVVEVHQVIRDLAGNTIVDQIVYHVYSIQNGLIERMEIGN